MCKKLIYFGSLVLMLAFVSISYGDDIEPPDCDPDNCVVIGSWEQVNDGWIDWGNGKLVDDPCNMPVQTTGNAGYQYSEEDVTLGEYSINVTASGWSQNLSINLNSVGHVGTFLDHTCFCIDVSVPGDDTPDASGWCEIYTISLNADGCGWNDLDETKPKKHWDYWEGVNWRHATLCWDYSDCLEEIVENPTYVEFIITTNSDGEHNDFYFDNARLCVPEPMTIALLGLGGIALIRRRK